MFSKVTLVAVGSLVAGYFLHGPLVGRDGVITDLVSGQPLGGDGSGGSGSVGSSDMVSISQDNAVHLDSDILKGFISKHCTECHGPDKQKGETRLDTLSLAITNSDTALHWQEVLDALNLGEMPPEEQPAPSEAELKLVLAHLSEALAKSKKRLSESGGNVALRRINKREYKNTIDQLFGFRVPDEILPPDDISEGYDTVGQDQQFSSYHFDYYFDAGKIIAKEALRWVDVARAESKVKMMEPETGNHKLQKYIEDYDKKMAVIKAGGTHKDIGVDDEKQLKMFVDGSHLTELIPRRQLVTQNYHRNA